MVCCEERQTDLAYSLLTLSPVEATTWTAETATWLQCRRYPPSTNPCFSLSGTNPAMPFSVQGLVLGAPEACSQSPSSQPSRGLLPCTAQQPQPQPPQQPPPQPQGLPPAAQQQPAMSNHMISQVSCCPGSRDSVSSLGTRRGGRNRARVLWIHTCPVGFGYLHACCLLGSDGSSMLRGLAVAVDDAVWQLASLFYICSGQQLSWQGIYSLLLSGGVMFCNQLPSW